MHRLCIDCTFMQYKFILRKLPHESTAFMPKSTFSKRRVNEKAEYMQHEFWPGTLGTFYPTRVLNDLIQFVWMSSRCGMSSRFHLLFHFYIKCFSFEQTKTTNLRRRKFFWKKSKFLRKSAIFRAENSKKLESVLHCERQNKDLEDKCEVSSVNRWNCLCPKTWRLIFIFLFHSIADLSFCLLWWFLWFSKPKKTKNEQKSKSFCKFFVFFNEIWGEFSQFLCAMRVFWFYFWPDNARQLEHVKVRQLELRWRMFVYF